MKIVELHVANFKAIDQVSLTALSDVVVIAGANGSGKSTIFDAIRLWKSTIGSYQKDELQSWLNELGFGNRPTSLLEAHQNRDEPFSIRATVSLTTAEISYLKDNAVPLLAFYFYKNSASSHPMAPPVFTMQNLELVDDFRSKKAQIMQQVEAVLPEVRHLPEPTELTGTVEVSPEGGMNVDAPFVLKLVLSLFTDEIGVIEYYGPHRTFGRERVDNLKLDIETQMRTQRQSAALYNSAGKYSNVKTELASSYVKSLIASSAGESTDATRSLEQSVSELFTQFIPGKSFTGVQPTREGSLTFNVRTAVGFHDINELSSGEKELIYGYLRLRNSGLRNSVIMIDEPELHLNPRLTDGLPDFYYRHIGRPLDNQLWLVTHSDTILRQSVGYEGFRVFHMKTVGTYENDDAQLAEITARSDLHRAIIDLVGDLAAFKPGGKLVILEGGGETEFDLRLIQRLFPSFSQRVNLVSSESKARVRALHAILEKLGSERDLFSGVYSIVDSDNNLPGEQQGSSTDFFQWNRCHIENYLLDEYFIRKVLVDNFVVDEVVTSDDILSWLRDAASATKEALIRHEMENIVRKLIASAVKARTSKSDPFNVEALGRLVDRAIAQLTERRADSLGNNALAQHADGIELKLNQALASNDWLTLFRGRDVLRAFVAARCNGRLSYEDLRNQISARMRDVEYQPIGMGQVLARIDAGPQ